MAEPGTMTAEESQEEEAPIGETSEMPSEPEAEAAQDVAGPGAPAWSLSVARFLGRAARWANRPGGKRWKADLDPRPTSALLQELGDMVSGRRGELGDLERDPGFWTLVELLHARRPTIVRAGAEGAAPASDDASDEAADASAGEDPAPKPKSKGKAKAKAAADASGGADDAAEEAADEAGDGDT